ncbi:T9SS type A sorting domain-containing protein [Fluviicola taffensis]|uniref:Secretion system C-terminal sorting domain-containing protein n=1 Tax=Fluviicola taffensis (strain DSM 16823 / NCIMB 13979 / RW262) TaxID=755732 RepID=F2I9K0_FLUTR|nr:T9SS type A sorting domain-containing protein [Fluviicola taffensis]AEA45181.1 hypothetical protein Fluta_3208 [Fluviicola taffensis DSM 16823]
MKKTILLFSLLFYCFPTEAQLEWLSVTSALQSTEEIGAAAMVVDNSGNTYSCGNFYSTLDFDPGSGTHYLTAFNNFDTYVRKLDSDGHLVWVIALGGTEEENALGLAIDNNQHILVTGFFNDTVDFDPGIGIYQLTSLSSTGNAFAVKLDLNGNFEWAKSFPSTGHSRVKTAVFNANSECFLVGEFSMEVDVDPNAGTALNTSNYGGVFISKLDANGNFIWGGSFPGEGWNESYGIDDTSDGGCAITGSFEYTTDFDPGPGVHLVSPNIISHIFLVKLSGSGNLDWVKTYGSQYYHQPGSIAVSDQGNYYLTGDYSDTTDFNLTGTPQVLIGTGRNTFILKLDSSGNFIWVKGVDGDANFPGRILLDSDENCIITGSFTSHVSFNSGAITFDSPWNSDAFALSLNASGGFNWVFIIPSSSLSSITGIGKDPDGNVYVGGTFFGTTDFDPGPGTLTIPASPQDPSVFILKLNSTLSVKDISTKNEFAIFPNPSKDILTIYSAFDQTESIAIYDLTGCEMRSNQYSNTIDVSDLTSGTYLIVRNSRREEGQIFVKE